MKYVEYKKYNNLSEWWEKAGREKFPCQVPIGISKLQKQGATFQESFEYLVDNKVIIFCNKKGKI